MLRPAIATLAGALVSTALVSAIAPTPASAAPAIGACYDYRSAVLDARSTAAPAVDCATPHTAETYFVGTVTDALGVPSKASQARVLAASRPCSVNAMNTYLGVPDRRLPSRFQTAVLFPTDAQWAAGERWIRCDVVLQAGVDLKTYAGTAAALVAASAPEQFDFCTPAEPNARRTAAYPCTNPKRNWIKVLDRELGGAGSRFPGTAKVERRTRTLCAAQGKRWDGKQKYPGWWAIWPTSVGWRQGMRSAQCFVPYAQYLKELQSRQPKPAPAPAPAPSPSPTATPAPAA